MVREFYVSKAVFETSVGLLYGEWVVLYENGDCEQGRNEGCLD